MKKKLEPIYLIFFPLLLSVMLVLGYCYKLRHGGLSGYLSLGCSLVVCVLAFLSTKKWNALTAYRCLAFWFALSCQIPATWINSCLGGTLPRIDVISSLVSEVYILLRFAIALAILYLAAIKLQISVNSRDKIFLILGGVFFLAGLLFPSLLYVTMFLFGACFFLLCAKLWTAVIDKTGYGIVWDILLFGFLYVRVLMLLII